MRFLLVIIAFYGTLSEAFVTVHQERKKKAPIGPNLQRESAAVIDAPGVTTRITPATAQLLSEKPLIYVVPNLLSSDECQSLMSRVQTLEETDEDRPTTCSNPPQVSINIQKLWPLAPLSLLAGLPPLIRFDDWSNTGALLQQVAPPILIALILAGLASFAAVPLLTLVSDPSSRTSDAMALNLEKDVDAEYCRLVDRVVDATGGHLHWEAPVVTRYAPGAIFAPHGDASPQPREWNELGGQRIVTCIVYLNSIQSGGETSFCQQGPLNVAPEEGKALVFFPAHADTLLPDETTLHESLGAPDETKWIVQLFGRTKKVPSPLGLPQTYLDAKRR